MKNYSLVADRIGIVASTTCALHCLLAPVLLLIGATLPLAFLADESFHKALLFAVVPAALIAFWLGCSRHKDRWVIGLGFVGLISICSAVFLHDVLGEDGERLVTFVSAALLVAAHIRNYRLCRVEDCAHD